VFSLIDVGLQDLRLRTGFRIGKEKNYKYQNPKGKTVREQMDAILSASGGLE
jgi:hypothetical protein